jgi:plasmid stability protein
MVMPSKGVRVQATMRLPVDLHRAAVARANAHHWSLNEYLCHVLRQAVPVEVPEPVGRTHARTYTDDGELIQ